MHLASQNNTFIGDPSSPVKSLPKGVSCADAIESVQEAIKSYIDNGGEAYQCFYGLEKAFDSIEYSVLLHHLYQAGINRKALRLNVAFYVTPTARLRVNSRFGDEFTLEHGVKQGSMVSPLLFLVIDELLRELECGGNGSSFSK